MTTFDSLEAQPARTQQGPEPRPFYWSVRRELWENRSIWMVPLIVTAVVLFASLVNTHDLPERLRAAAADPSKAAALGRVFDFAPAPIMFFSIVVGLWYSLDALYGERRDRSILFWKSLPVSDTTTVLAKASIPIVVLPALACALSMLLTTVLLLGSSAIAVVHGLSPAPLWAQYGIVEDPLIMVYGMGVHALWYAPIYAWFLLVSAWAKRAPVLWAVLPPALIIASENIAGTGNDTAQCFVYRWNGAMTRGFIVRQGSHGVPNVDTFADLTPLRFLATPGLWGGLIVAALFLFAAIRLRRAREPI